MTQILYHPLVDADSEGAVKVPMFCTSDLSQMQGSGKLYLEEIVPKVFRLCSNDGDCENNYQPTIRCPYCGSVLKMIDSTANENRLALYSCRECY